MIANFILPLLFFMVQYKQNITCINIQMKIEFRYSGLTIFFKQRLKFLFYRRKVALAFKDVEKGTRKMLHL
jgi:hypothetical protein